MHGVSAPAAELTFGRYEALFRIAAGGMAEVYAARIRGEAGFQKLVAVKRMLPHLVESEEFVTMFLDEARVAAHISSPHVVQTFDLGRADDGALYIAMELVVGVTLSALCRTSMRLERAIPMPFLLEVIAQAAQGLDDAHEATTPAGQPLHLVHRDVSPQNILIGGDGRVRVTDFGIARAIMRQTHTRTGVLKGKYAYFSPEQATGKDVDRRSDIFSLGIVAWEAMTMCPLFHDDDPVGVMKRVCMMEVPSPREYRPDIPEAAARAVLRALDRDRERRFATAADFTQAVRASVRERPSQREMAQVVADLGGAALARMQSHIARADSGAQPGEFSNIDLKSPEVVGANGPSGSTVPPRVEIPVSVASGVIEKPPEAPAAPPAFDDETSIYNRDAPPDMAAAMAASTDHMPRQNFLGAHADAGDDDAGDAHLVPTRVLAPADDGPTELMQDDLQRILLEQHGLSLGGDAAIAADSARTADFAAFDGADLDSGVGRPPQLAVFQAPLPPAPGAMPVGQAPVGQPAVFELAAPDGATDGGGAKGVVVAIGVTVVFLAIGAGAALAFWFL